MRTCALVLAMLLAIAAAAVAHPAPGVVCTPDGRIYLVVVPQPRILQFSPGQKQPVVAIDFSGRENVRVLHHLVLRDGHLHTANDAGSSIWKFNPQDATAQQIYPLPGARDVAPIGLGGDPFTIDAGGRIVAAQRSEDGGYSLARIDPDGVQTLLAGGARGVQDGRGAAAGFGDLHSTTLALGPGGAIYLADSGRFIRRISPEGDVTTLFPPPRPANVPPDGNALAAGELRGVAVADDGTIYAADATNRCILRLRPDGSAARLGAAPAAGEPALMEPIGVALHPSGDVVVLDAHRAGDAEEIRLYLIRPDDSIAQLGSVKVR
jgi:streptogramin lyase